MGVRQERRVARTRELLDAAMDLVVEDGMAGLTIGSLAERVEAAVGAIYRYFPSKTALITALQVRAVEELREVVDAALARLDASEAPREVALLAAAIAVPYAYARHLQERPARRMLINRSLAAPAPVLPEEEAFEVDAALRPVLERMVARLSAAAEAGLLEAGDARQRAMLAWAGVQGLSLFVNRDRLQPPELRSPALIAPLLEALLRGWGAEAASARAALAALAG